MEPGRTTPPQWRTPDSNWRTLWIGSKSCTALGWSGFALGNVLRFAAMRFGAQAVLSALTSAQFCVIPVTSYFLLGERTTFATLLSIAVVLFGNALIIWYGPEEVHFTLEQLQLQWVAKPMLIFIAALLIVLAALHAATVYVRILERNQTASHQERWRGRAKPATTSLTFAHAILYSAFSAFIGASSVLFSKSLTYIITAPWPSQLWSWYCWAVVAAFVASAVFWVMRTAEALRMFPAGLVMSVMQAFWMVQSIVAGGIYFDEFRQLRGWPAFVFSIGLVSAIAGALGMGCASFFADQHAMISYSMLPGYQDEDSVLEVSEQRRLSAYSAPFIGIAQQGAAGPGQMQMHHISLQSLEPGSEEVRGEITSSATCQSTAVAVAAKSSDRSPCSAPSKQRPEKKGTADSRMSQSWSGGDSLTKDQGSSVLYLTAVSHEGGPLLQKGPNLRGAHPSASSFTDLLDRE